VNEQVACGQRKIFFKPDSRVELGEFLLKLLKQGLALFDSLTLPVWGRSVTKGYRNTWVGHLGNFLDKLLPALCFHRRPDDNAMQLSHLLT